MSLWPEHTRFRVAHKTQAAIQVLVQGPDKDSEIRRLCLGISGHTMKFPEARLKYHPGPEEPTHILVWTPQVALVVDYHEVDYVVWDEEVNDAL